jgi:enoyl-CoA hydratase/carnithine racemase
VKLTWEIIEDVGELTLSAPPSNTLTIDSFQQFGEIIKQTREIGQLKAIIIRGKGRHFSSGVDLQELLPNINKATLINHFEAFSALYRLNIPVFASISGVCLGAAFELALTCHFRIASPEAVFGMPETTYNLIPAIGGTARLLALTSKANTMKLLLHGNTISAAEALEIGVVDKIVSKDEIHTFIHRVAGSIPRPFNVASRNLYLNKYIR